jgi:hypothetical protein
VDQDRKRLLRNFLIELVTYAILVVAYFIIVLRVLGQPLNELYHTNLHIYAAAGLGLIVAQGVVLEWVTSFLIDLLGLERLE